MSCIPTEFDLSLILIFWFTCPTRFPGQTDGRIAVVVVVMMMMMMMM